MEDPVRVVKVVGVAVKGVLYVNAAHVRVDVDRVMVVISAVQLVKEKERWSLGLLSSVCWQQLGSLFVQH